MLLAAHIFQWLKISALSVLKKSSPIHPVLMSFSSTWNRYEQESNHWITYITSWKWWSLTRPYKRICKVKSHHSNAGLGEEYVLFCLLKWYMCLKTRRVKWFLCHWRSSRQPPILNHSPFQFFYFAHHFTSS